MSGAARHDQHRGLADEVGTELGVAEAGRRRVQRRVGEIERDTRITVSTSRPVTSAAIAM